MRTPALLLVIGVLLAPSAAAGAAGVPVPLQPLIDATPIGGTLKLAPGTYAGPVAITKTMTLDGGGAAVVENDGNGTVVTVEGSGITVQGLTIRNSGQRHDRVDSAIKTRGRYLVIKDNRIENCLFGIDLEQTDRSVVRHNRISSRDDHLLPQKGDAIRLWYSNDNAIQDNIISGARDMVVWYSKGNVVRGNVVTGGQYGLHFMYAHDNRAEANRFSGSVVGIFVMYGDRNTLVRNRVEYAQGPSGIGIGFKEASGTRVEDNDILGSAVGLYLDASPYEPDLDNEFVGNRIAFNGIALHMHSDWTGNVFRGNDFVSNHSMVAVGGGGSAGRNRWEGNHYDTFEGFDRNRDGTGDTPMEVWSWSDRLWMDVKEARFFRASPALELVDFIERLVPVTEPRLMLRDAAPRMSRQTDGGKNKEK